MAKRQRRNVRLGGISITVKEDELLDEFRNSSRGYDIECRFCGWKSVFHDEEEEQRWKDQDKQKHEPGSDVRKKGYRTTLQNCANNIGYVPANLRQWRQKAREWGDV